MTATILLIRHGSHDRLGRMLCGRMPEVTLSRAGKIEAEALAMALAARHTVEAIYASPLERARETAEPLAEACGLSVLTEPDAMEIDFGDWTGRGFDDLASDPRWADWNRARDHSQAPGGESMGEAQIRIVRALRRISRAHDGGTVALVSHADVIKAALCWGLGLSLGFLARFEVSPASLSRIMLDDETVKVWSVNENPAA